jgi:hypothetical protein
MLLAGFPKRISPHHENRQKSAVFRFWHDGCKVPGIGGERFAPISKGTNTMFLRLELAQRTAFSVVAALAFAAVAISAAVPVTPIA